MKAAYWEIRWTGFRFGSTRIVLEWDGGEAEAVLYDEGVPRTSAAVLAALPLTVPVIHVAWSGDVVMTPHPLGIGMPEAENQVRLPLPGDLGWDPSIEELTFTYGVAECHTPLGPHAIVIYGSIAKGLDKFAEFARARRFEGVGEVRMKRLESAPAQSDRASP